MAADVEQVARRLTARWGVRFDAPALRRLERAVARLGTGDERALVEAVTVQETSWFRDAPVFRVLEHELIPRVASRPVRIWSAGCALGQEVWSLAILCAERGLPCEVVGSDVSRAALARAAAGEYGERELRGLSSARRARWLADLGDGRFRVREELRRGVSFVAHDLVSEAPPFARGTVDLVLCRYVLIYLSPGAVERVLARVEELLRPGGRLLVGGAESLWHLTERFEVDALDGAFAYRPRAARKTARQRATRAAVPGTAAPAPVAEDAAVPGTAAPAPPAWNAAVPGPAAAARDAARPSAAGQRDALLAEGEAAVARGELEEAVRAFRGAAYLDPDSALAHLQLGLALEAAADPGAPRAFRAARSALVRRSQDAVQGWRADELVRLVDAKLGGGR